MIKTERERTMSTPKIQAKKTYYLVLHKIDWTYKPAVIVPVEAVRREKHCKYDWWVVKQIELDSCITVHEDWLAPTFEKGKDLLYNMKQWEKRWSFNGWRSRLRYDTAKAEIEKELSKLSVTKKKEILHQFKLVYPQLVKKDGSFLVSKMKMTQWDELAWAINATKHPLKEIWVGN